MDEERWQSCEDWRPMLAFLSGRLSQRQGMLYVCAGLRSLWELLYDDGSQYAVEVAEEAAEGKATVDDLRYAGHYAEVPTFGFDFDTEYLRRNFPTGWWGASAQRLLEMGVYTLKDIFASGNLSLGDEQTRSRLPNAANIAYFLLRPIDDGRLGEHLLNYLSHQSEWPGGWLVREIIGNPFRPLAISPEWLTWNGGAAFRLAQLAYDERTLPAGTLDNGRLAVLAGALEEAGCDDARILAHLRGGGEHYRGCFVLDALLNKV